MEERWEKIEKKMETIKADRDQKLDRILQMMETMMMNQNQGIVKFQEDIQEVKNDQKELQLSLSVGERFRAEKAAVSIQAFLRTTLVRVKLYWLARIGRGRSMMRFAPFRMAPWWKDYRERQEAKARARAAAKARKRAKAKQRKQVKLDAALRA